MKKVLNRKFSKIIIVALIVIIFIVTLKNIVNIVKINIIEKKADIKITIVDNSKNIVTTNKAKFPIFRGELYYLIDIEECRLYQIEKNDIYQIRIFNEVKNKQIAQDEIYKLLNMIDNKKNGKIYTYNKKNKYPTPEDLVSKKYYIYYKGEKTTLEELPFTI